MITVSAEYQEATPEVWLRLSADSREPPTWDLPRVSRSRGHVFPTSPVSPAVVVTCSRRGCFRLWLTGQKASRTGRGCTVCYSVILRAHCAHFSRHVRRSGTRLTPVPGAGAHHRICRRRCRRTQDAQEQPSPTSRGPQPAAAPSHALTVLSGTHEGGPSRVLVSNRVSSRTLPTQC